MKNSVPIRGIRLTFPEMKKPSPAVEFRRFSATASGTMEITEVGRQFFAEAHRRLQERLDEDGGWREVGGALLVALEEGRIEIDDVMMRIAR